ncbi:hypothetical protein GmHk_13G036476 [Glycine max]|nr:hypothetical protein GmHk_13G036476 [Glycine max]
MEARLKGISSGEGISPIKASHQVVHPIHAEVPVFSHHIGTRSSGSGVGCGGGGDGGCGASSTVGEMPLVAGESGGGGGVGAELA